MVIAVFQLQSSNRLAFARKVDAQIRMDLSKLTRRPAGSACLLHRFVLGKHQDQPRSKYQDQNNIDHNLAM